MMGIYRKILIIIKSNYLKVKYHLMGVKIKDFANAYISIPNGSINGNGTLYLNQNAITYKENLKLRIDDGGVLVVNGDVSLYSNTNIHIGNDAVLSIGDGTYVNEGTKISIKHRCVIGKHCAISNDVTLLDSDFHKINGIDGGDRGVTIGNHVWICANVTILKNVTIGDDCIIGANALVLSDIPSGCIAAGNPARVIKKCVSWN